MSERWHQTLVRFASWHFASSAIISLLHHRLIYVVSPPLCLQGRLPFMPPPPPFLSAAQIQRALVRNNQTQRFSQKQALRLHQGLVTSTAEQVALVGAALSSPRVQWYFMCARLS